MGRKLRNIEINWVKITKWMFGIIFGTILFSILLFKVWISTWKTYQSKDAYSLRYPSYWHKYEESGPLRFSASKNFGMVNLNKKENSGSLIVKTYVKTKGRSLDEFARTTLNIKDDSILFQHINLGKYKGIKFLYHEGESIFTDQYLLVEKEGSVISFLGYIKKNYRSTLHALLGKIILQEIINSIRFY